MMLTKPANYFLGRALTMLMAARAGFLLLIFILAPISVSETATQNDAKIWLQAPGAPIEIGEEIIVTIRISDVVDLYGLQLELDFDPTDLQVIDADPDTIGVQITPVECPADDFIIINQTDNSAGVVEYSVAQLNPTLPVSGNCAVAHVLFQMQREAVTTLDFGEVTMLADRNGNVIPSTQMSLTLRTTELTKSYLPLIHSWE